MVSSKLIRVKAYHLVDMRIRRQEVVHSLSSSGSEGEGQHVAGWLLLFHRPLEACSVHGHTAL